MPEWCAHWKCVPWHNWASRLLSPSYCNWNWLGGPWKMGACHHYILHESLRSVEEQGLPQTPADITDRLLFPRRTFPRGWKGAENLSSSCRNFSSPHSLPFPNYIISLEPHFLKSLIHTTLQIFSNPVCVSVCVSRAYHVNTELNESDGLSMWEIPL